MVQVEEALARGTDVVFRLDIQGAHTIRCKFPDALSIFLVRAPPQHGVAAAGHGTDAPSLEGDVCMHACGSSFLPRTVCQHDAWAQVAESEAVLACRLISRKTEPLDKMITRVQTARQEMRHLRSFDFGARSPLTRAHHNSSTVSREVSGCGRAWRAVLS